MDDKNELLTSGQFAEVSQLSGKALRLYDERGVLRPVFVDPENRYRYYHPDQLETAVFIRLLRQMEMPLATIKRVLQASETAVAEQQIHAYYRAYQARIAQAEQAMQQVAVHLFNKEIKMQTQNDQKEGIWLAHLEPMRLVRFQAEGISPEGLALDKLAAWAGPRGLLDDTKRRLFGFNNPDPHPDRDEYGYEVWLEVGGDLDVARAEIVEFGGGLYAVSSVQGIDNIGPGWQRLVAWNKQTPAYEYGRHQWLEEILSPLTAAQEEARLDLYMPIMEVAVIAE